MVPSLSIESRVTAPRGGYSVILPAGASASRLVFHLHLSITIAGGMSLNDRTSGRRIYAADAGLTRAPADVRKAHCDEFLHERLRQGAVDWEVQRALGDCVAVKLIGKLREH